VHVVEVSERGTSSRESFTGRGVGKFEPLMIRTTVKRSGKVKVLKTVLRVTKVGGRALERDVTGAINIGLRCFSTDGSPMVLGSTGTHEVWVKLVNLHRGATPLTVLNGICEYCNSVSGETLVAVLSSSISLLPSPYPHPHYLH
jgi:hypothetical protein